MLYWLYIAMVIFFTILIGIELFKEPKLKNKIAYAMALIPFILRIFQVK